MYPAEGVDFPHVYDKLLAETLIAARPIMNFPFMAIMFMIAASITQYLPGVADDVTTKLKIGNSHMFSTRLCF